MLDPFAPTANGTGCFKFQVAAGRAPGSLQYAQINFAVDGEPDAGIVGADVFYAWYDYIVDAWDGLCYSGLSYPLATMTLTIAGTTLRYTGYWLNGPFDPPAILPSNSCAVLSLYSTLPGRSGRGIFRIPKVPEWYWHGDYFNSSFEHDVMPWCQILQTPWTYGGITLYPSVWSRKLAAMHAILSVQIMPRISYLSKRSPQRVNPNPWISLPNTW
jgi:hypothetical protein